jgi:hypothetical protein
LHTLVSYSLSRLIIVAERKDDTDQYIEPPCTLLCA